jgi:hypothetical protein
MQLAIDQKTSHESDFAPKTDARALKIFARTLFKDMQKQGLTNDQIIAMATQLLGHVTDSIKDSRPLGRA